MRRSLKRGEDGNERSPFLFLPIPHWQLFVADYDGFELARKQGESSLRQLAMRARTRKAVSWLQATSEGTSREGISGTNNNNNN
jgi:hypothetical protein